MNGAPTGEADFGLKHHQRLTKSTDFQQVFENGRKLAGKCTVMWLDSKGKGRLGVVASKRTFRRAVDRNRAKRLLREAFRRARGSVDFSGDVVLVARGRILDVKRQQVEEEIIKLISNNK